MPADRPLHNLTRDRLLGIYLELQGEAPGKKYNLRKELQTDKRDNVVYANRWVTHDQFIEMAHQELLARGVDLPVSDPIAEAGPAPTTAAVDEATPTLAGGEPPTAGAAPTA